MYDEINEHKFILECESFIEDTFAASYIAFYLSKGYFLNVLGPGTFMQHFNSAIDVFNIDFKNTDKLIMDVKQILKNKYRLEIIDEKQLKIKEI